MEFHYKGKAIGLILILMLLALPLVKAVAGAKSYFIPSDVRKLAHTDYVMPTLESPGTGFLTPATATLDVGTSSVRIIGTMPAGAQVLRLYAYNGDVSFGDASLTTGTALLFPYVASGSLSDPIPLGTTTPTVYVTGRTASASVRPVVR